MPAVISYSYSPPPTTLVGPLQKAHCATIKIQIFQLWDFIETWDFREDLKPIVFSYLSGGPFYVIEAESINGFRIPAHF